MKREHCSNTIFYIVAHADDWQLFMNPETYRDIICSQNRVVFIITTAGDAGMGEVFWHSREEGMKSSILYPLTPGGQLKFKEGSKSMNDGRISYWSVNNVITYFLRLPDGGVAGEGFDNNNYNNLSKLEKGTISSLRSLDGTLLLSSWTSLSTLLEQIICIESGNEKGNISVKFLDPDEQNNAMDHADHRSTGRSILSIKDLPAHTKVLFKGYGISGGIKLTAEEIFWKASMFAVYDKTVFEKTGYSTLAEDPGLYKKWILSGPEFRVDS